MISIRVKNEALKKKSGFLNFSQKTDYGLFLLSRLVATFADNKMESPVSLREIADKNDMSFYFLQKVALDLRKAGLIKALRGKNGGYVLNGSADKIDLIEVLEALEGPFSLMPCLDNAHCGREENCQVRSGVGMINDLIIQTLSKFTLLDFINSKWQPKK